MHFESASDIRFWSQIVPRIQNCHSTNSQIMIFGFVERIMRSNSDLIHSQNPLRSHDIIGSRSSSMVRRRGCHACGPGSIPGSRHQEKLFKIDFRCVLTSSHVRHSHHETRLAIHVVADSSHAQIQLSCSDFADPPGFWSQSAATSYFVLRQCIQSLELAKPDLES